MMREGPLQGGPQPPVETPYQPRPAFAALLWEAFPAAYRAARHVADTPAAAEELLLAAVRLAYREQALRPRDARFTTWLLRLVARVHRAGRPVLRDHTSAAFLFAIASAGDETRQLPADWGQPPSAALAAFTSADLSAAVRALPFPERTAVAFFVSDELTTDELALILDIAPEAARAQLRRGRRLLSAAIRRAAAESAMA